MTYRKMIGCMSLIDFLYKMQINMLDNGAGCIREALTGKDEICWIRANENDALRCDCYNCLAQLLSAEATK